MKIHAALETTYLIHLTIGEQSFYLTAPQAEQLMAKLQFIVGKDEGYALQVQNAVCAVFGCSMSALVSKSRAERLVIARATAYVVMFQAGMTVKKIGEMFGRDRGTVEHGLQALKDRIWAGYEPQMEAVKELVKSAQLSAYRAPKDS